jgi:hypothetical protein
MEDYDEYTLIHVEANLTKARNEHIRIIIKDLADWRHASRMIPRARHTSPEDC